MMSSSVFIAGIVIGGIVTIIAIVFTILSLVGGKRKRAIAWIGGFIVAVGIIIASLVKMVQRIETKAANSIDLTKVQDNHYNSEERKVSRQFFTDTLKMYVNENLKSKVPADFYEDRSSNKIINGQVNLPFLYPFSIHYHPATFFGDIANDAADSVYLKNIIQMAFDQNFMIACVVNTPEGALPDAEKGKREYILFDLRTREYLNFTSLKELLEKADKIGYTGPLYMNNLSDDYHGWIDVSAHD